MPSKFPATPAQLRNRKKLGEWLRGRREELGRSLRECAQLGRCSDAWLCQLESGHADVTAVKVTSLARVALAYKIPFGTLCNAILKAAGVRLEQCDGTETYPEAEAAAD